MLSREMRRARTLYHEWRLLPDGGRERIAPLAREVKELALDLRGHVDQAHAEAGLALANQRLEGELQRAALPKAA